jgi:hypothetical protein
MFRRWKVFAWWGLATLNLWILASPDQPWWLRVNACVWAVWFTVAASLEASQ